MLGTTPVDVFVSYAHEDERLFNELQRHLAILNRRGVIASWHDRKITAGIEWAGQIDEHLNTASMILFLVSSDFLASDYCWDVEMKRALERHEAGEARVIPIILRPCDWHIAPFGKLQALPKDAQPVTTWGSRDAAFINIADGILSTVKTLHKHPQNQLISKEARSERITITIEGELEDVDSERIRELISALQELTGDQSIAMSMIEPGSVAIILDATEEGFKVLNSLHKSGLITEIAGLPVLHIEKTEYKPNQKQEILESFEVFISYSHKDEEFREKLGAHLSNLKRQNIVKEWHDRKITAGTEWAGQIDEHLKIARIILLLISADFMKSDYCNDIEVTQAMKRHEAGEARVIPIILRPCDWEGAPFSKLQGLPKDAKAVTTWDNEDSALLDVVQGIRVVITELKAHLSSKAS